MTSRSNSSVGIRYCLVPVAVFSIVFNLSLLVSPIYMLQIYDRVLASQSLITLLLITLVAVAFVAVGSLIKHYRAQVAQRLANLIRDRFGVVITEGLNAEVDKLNQQGNGKQNQDGSASQLKDLNTVVNFVASPRFGNAFDLPWVPLFMLLLFVVHPYLGLVASVFGLILLGMGILAHGSKENWGRKAVADEAAADNFLVHSLKRTDVLRALGMSEATGDRWREHRQQAATKRLIFEDMNSSSDAIRIFLKQTAQIATLGLGAYLVIQEFISAGMIVAGSIICSRALAPLDSAPSTSLEARVAYRAYRRLAALLPKGDQPLPVTNRIKDRTSAHLVVEDIEARKQVGDRTLDLTGVSLSLQPGTLLGIIGPDAEVKRLFASMLAGETMPMSGRISLGGVDIHDMTSEEICRHIGYIPNDDVFLDGTIGQNIARFQPISEQDLADAARCADLHEKIMRFEKGYDTTLHDAVRHWGSLGNAALSVARAFYRKPDLIVAQDADRLPKALVRSIVSTCRSNGQSLVMNSDQESTIALLDLLGLLAHGRLEGTGPPKRVIEGLRSQRTQG